MFHKSLLLCVVLALVQFTRAGYIFPGPVPVAAAQLHAVPTGHEFGYQVADPLSLNYQHHQQSSQNGVVVGSYSVLDADGSHRFVDYTADSLNGFKAVVQKAPGVVVQTYTPFAPAVVVN